MSFCHATPPNFAGGERGFTNCLCGGKGCPSVVLILPASIGLPCPCHLKHTVQQAAKQVSIDQLSAAFALVHAGSQTGQKL